MGINRDFKGVWIPKEIWLNKDLTIMEKLFLVEIDSLDNDKGCFASNAHFAEFFGITKGRCTQIIKSLEKKGLVTIKLEREGKNVSKRIIKVVRKLNTLVSKLNTPLSETKHPYLENDEGSNTSNSNTNSNTSRSKLKFETQHLKLAELLYKQIKNNLPNYPEKDLEKWANEFRLMMERDKREGEEIQDLIIKTQNHHFWKKNILSPSKLRKQYDRLVIEFEDNNNFKPGNNIKTGDNASDYLEGL